MKLFTHDASYYANQIRNKTVTSLELTKQALDNVKQLNPLLNAVNSVQETYALNYAKTLDHQLKHRDTLDDLPPFYGVPTLLKDVGHSQAGFPSTSGSALLKHYRPSHTDRFVEDLLSAGFVIIGRTNVPEFAFKGISDSQFTGVVNSPFDFNRNPGGSSGGAAAALKAGIVPITMGSDGGGSIRLPASFNGLIGLKPSRGRIGVGPNSYRGWQGASVNFALTKSVQDTWELLNFLQVEQLDAPFTVPLITTSELTDLDRPLTIAYSTESPIGADVSDISKANLAYTVNLLKSLGHQLINVQPPTDDKAILKSYYKMNCVETAAMFHSIERAIGRVLTSSDVEPMTWLLYKAGETISAPDYSQLLSSWDRYSAERESFIAQYDLALTPITNGPAPIHGQFEYHHLVDDLSQFETLTCQEQQQLIWDNFEQSHNYMAYALYQNIGGQPAISLPLFETDQGLPMGSHFWAGKGQEYVLLQLAKQLETNGHLKTTIHHVL